MTDREAEDTFARLRWSDNDGKPFCPHCGSLRVYTARRPNGAPRYRCQGCHKDFSVTSGTIFAWHKLPLRVYLLAIVISANEVKGKSMLALRRDLRVQYKTAFVLSHKIREAVSAEIAQYQAGGPGKEVQVDGVYVGGYAKPHNEKAKRVDRRLSENRTDKRKVVVAIREKNGRTLTRVFGSEIESVPFIRQRVADGTVIHADESSAWNILHARYDVRRINHNEAYSLNGACTNDAESFFSRLRRGEYRHHHHIAGPYLARFAQESAWREDHRRDSNGEQVDRVIGLAMRARPSVDFCGYWQRSYARSIPKS
jgi:transposase-like protein